MFRSNLALAAAVLGAMALMGCSDVNDPKPFDPRELQSKQRDASHQFSNITDDKSLTELPTTLPATTRRSSTTSTQPVIPPGFDAGVPTTKMSLREMVQRTVANNLDVKVAGYDPAIEGTRVVENEAKFDPVYFADAQYERRDNLTAGNFVSDPSTNATAISFLDQADIYTADTGVKQNLPSGGQARLRYSTSYNDVAPIRSSLNPYWENNLSLEITQPLFRNFGSDVNRANITIARNNQRISLLDFRKSLEEQIANTETTYWNLSKLCKKCASRKSCSAVPHGRWKSSTPASIRT